MTDTMTHAAAARGHEGRRLIISVLVVPRRACLVKERTTAVFHSNDADIGSGRPYYRPLGGADARGGVPGAADQPE